MMSKTLVLVPTVAVLMMMTMKGCEGAPPLTSGLASAGNQVNPNTAGAPSSWVFDQELMVNGIQAFSDVPGSRLHDVPPPLLSNPTTFVRLTHRFPGNTENGYLLCFDTVDLEGAVHPAPVSPYDACDVSVYFYHCPPCASNKGSMPAEYVADGWTLSSCAPTFTTEVAGGVRHAMLSVNKRVATGGTIQTLAQPGLIDWEMMSYSLSRYNCAARNGDEMACLATNDLCRWEAGSGACIDVTCVRSPGPGAPRDCSVCVEDEHPPVNH